MASSVKTPIPHTVAEGSTYFCLEIVTLCCMGITPVLHQEFRKNVLVKTNGLNMTLFSCLFLLH